MPRTFEDITGKRYGMLVAEKMVGYDFNGYNNQAKWRFRCDCGNIIEVVRNEITRKRRFSGVISCGCMELVNRFEGLKKPDGYAALTNLVCRYRADARKAGTIFKLTRKQIAKLTSSECHYCGIKPSMVIRSKYGTGDYWYNGIDRKIPKLGYVISNCVSCCWECNQRKSDTPYNKFLNWVQRVYDNQGWD